MSRQLPILVLSALIPFTAGAETVSAPTDRTGLGLTITQQDLGIVRDRRGVTLPKGPSVLVVEGVAANAQAGGAALSASGILVREQELDLDGIDAAALLAQSVGQEVTLVWKDTPGEQRGRVLSAGAVPVFEIDGKVVAGMPRRVLFESLPEGMRAQPAYVANVVADKAGRREVELTYSTSGLSWSADYVADLADDSLTLSAWASLVNSSGADFADARVQVMAGSLNRVSEQPKMLRNARMEMMAAGAPMNDAEREAAGPYHVYTLPDPVTLRDGARRQVALMAPATLSVERVSVLDPMPIHAWRDRWVEPDTRHPTRQLRFKNSLGKPLPAGIVRVSQRGKDGTTLPIGEDRLAATPDGASTRITLGEEFDVTARRVQTDFQRVSPEVNEAAWEVRLTNGGDKPARILVREAFAGDWLVVEESEKHVKDSAFSAVWSVQVPAKGQAVLKYRVRVKG